MKLGPYEVESEIGRGGMGIVLRGRAPDGSVVALKVLLQPDARDRVARFDRERRLLAALGEGEGFVPLLDAGEGPRGPWLAMPFVAGGTLRDRLELEGRLDPGAVATLGRELARALAVAHERGIVHRDLKPENVLFTAGGRPLVADLGLAKHFRDDLEGASQSASLSREAGARGTLGYMAPEQLRDAKSVGPPADVFALGAILWECLAGRQAFEGDSALKLCALIEAARVLPLARERPDAPRWLRDVIHHALDRDPARRPANARELLALLERGPAGSASRGLRVATVVLAAVVLAALVLAGAVAGVAAWRASSPPAGRASPSPGGPPSLEAGHVSRPPAPASPAAGRATDEGNAEALAARANERGANGDVDGALADASRAATDLDPASGLAWTALGVARARSGDPGSAIQALDRAIALAPAIATAWAWRGAQRSKRGELAEALTDLDAALGLEPRNLHALVNRARLRLIGGDHAGSIADATTATLVSPGFVEAWDIRGAAKQLSGDLTGALADLDRALELAPAYPSAWANHSVVRYHLADLAGALADADRALALDPRSVVAWRTRANVLEQRGDLAGAIEAWSSILELEPVAMNWNTRGVMRIRKGDVEGAIADFTRAIEIDGSYFTAWKNRGIARAQRGDRPGALSDYERALAIAPDHRDAPTVRAELARLRAQH